MKIKTPPELKNQGEKFCENLKARFVGATIADKETIRIWFEKDGKIDCVLEPLKKIR